MARLPAERIFLHAWRIAFTSPATGERVTVEAPLPADLSRLAGESIIVWCSHEVLSGNYVVPRARSALRRRSASAQGRLRSTKIRPRASRWTSRASTCCSRCPTRRAASSRISTKNDFEIIETKKPQSILEFTAETDLPLRIGILIDTSNSIRDRFRFQQDAATEFVNTVMRPGEDKAMVVSFDTPRSWFPI